MKTFSPNLACTAGVDRGALRSELPAVGSLLTNQPTQERLMRSKDEIGRFSLRSSEKITVEELEDYEIDDRDIYFVYLIGYQGYVRDQAEMLYDPDEEEAIITWNGDTERGEAADPEEAAIQWVDDTFTGNGENGEQEAEEEEEEDEDED